MTPGAYASGLAVAGAYVLAVGWCGFVLTRILAPAWPAALIALGSTIVAISTLLTLGEGLGSVGLLTRWAFAGAAVVAALAATVLFRRRPMRPGPSPIPSVPVPVGEAALTAAAVVFALVSFAKRIGSVYRNGMLEWDTHWYHEPVAARFAQTGDVTQLHYVNNPADLFLPFNSELVHAVGMVATGRDVLSPLINGVWVAVALLAAWCLGSVCGARVPAVVAVALAISTPVMVYASAGSAGNDLPALALLLAALALIANGPTSAPAVALAGLAAGLAVGTKLTLFAPVFALSCTLGVIWIRSRRWRLAGLWAVGLLFTGSFWYVRNSVRAHNPFPWFEIGIGHLSLPSSAGPPSDCGSTTVAHYLTDGHVVRSVFEPGLAMAFGARWALLVVAAAGGALLALRFAGLLRVLGVTALLSGAAYVVTPATAGGPAGNPTCFEYNTRFSTPALALGLICLALGAAQWRRVSPTVVTIGLLLVLAANVPLTPVRVAAALGAGLVGASLLRFAGRPTPRMVAAGVAGAAVIAVVGGWPVQKHYFEHRYVAGYLPEPIVRSALRLRTVRDARIAVAGFQAHYALYDADLSNWVEYPAARGPHGIFRAITSCRAWQAALTDGRFDYVVTYQSDTNRAPPEAAWTQSYPGAVRIVHSDGNDLFRLDPAPAGPKIECHQS